MWVTGCTLRSGKSLNLNRSKRMAKIEGDIMSDKEQSQLLNQIELMNEAEFNQSKLKPNAVTFFKMIQHMCTYGNKKITYKDQAFKQEGKNYEIYVTISRKKPRFWFLYSKARGA